MIVQDTLAQRQNTSLDAQHLTNTIMSAINPYVRQLVKEHTISQDEKNQQRQIKIEAEQRVNLARVIVDSIVTKIKSDPQIIDKIRVIVARTRDDLLNSPDNLIRRIIGKQLQFQTSTRKHFQNIILEHFFTVQLRSNIFRAVQKIATKNLNTAIDSQSICDNIVWNVKSYITEKVHEEIGKEINIRKARVEAEQRAKANAEETKKAIEGLTAQMELDSGITETINQLVTRSVDTLLRNQQELVSRIIGSFCNILLNCIIC